MRIYRSFVEALSEIKRDLAELGTRVKPARWQGKDVSGVENYETLEYPRYIYTVTCPNLSHLEPTQPWASMELNERFSPGQAHNPAEAWKLREDVWQPLLKEDGKFHYTYAERLKINRGCDNWEDQILDLVVRAQQEPLSRQLYLSIWDRRLDQNPTVDDRVPCSLGYHFMIRDGKLDMTYMMRSCDFVVHFQNDVWLALQTQLVFLDRLNALRTLRDEAPISLGHFIHFIISLHIHKKDAEGVF